jgi:hypothetical protein
MENQDEPLLDMEDPGPEQHNNTDFEDLELGNSAFLIDTTSSFDRQHIRTGQDMSNITPSNIFDDL